jgi:ubiquinone biosynthesis monooxygenase Coq7
MPAFVDMTRERIMNRKISILDNICLGLDQAVKPVFGKPVTTTRKNPASKEQEPILTPSQRKHSAALMRINHTGEVCAQALYHAQGLVSRNKDVKEKMQHAAIEEGDHLAWCNARITELASHTSYLNPVWYAGSFVIGLTAGLIGDKWNLGFLAETENQVVKHLDGHLKILPSEDIKSHKIVSQMRLDEAAHRDDAFEAGAGELPDFIKKLMRFSSRVMVKVTYWV